MQLTVASSSNPAKMNSAELAVLQGVGITGALCRTDAASAQYFAWHRESGHQFAAIIERRGALDEAIAHAIQAREAVADAVQASATDPVRDRLGDIIAGRYWHGDCFP